MSYKGIQNILLIILMLIMYSICNADATKNISDDYRFSMTYTNLSGTHQAGETIPLSIKRGTDGYWFDFNDDTFKNSSWTTKTANLTDDTTNHNYSYLWSSQGGDTTVNSYTFHVELTGEFISEETVSFQDIGASDLVATDNIGINLADVSNPTTTLGLTGTTIGITTAVTDPVVLPTATETQIDNIEADTNELQINQGSWLTATGFSIPNEYDTVIAALQTDLDNPTQYKATGFSTHSAADIWTSVTRTLTALGISVDISAASVDLIWDEANAEHVAIGSMGKKLSDIPLSGTGDWTVDEKTNIKEAMSIDNDSVDTDLDEILDTVIATGVN